MERMRPSERKVAAVVLRDPGAAVQLSMAALADAAGVSEPTVMRFCTGLGFAGFQSFKLGLAQALAIGLPVTHSAIELDDPVDAMAGKIFDHTLSSLDRTRRALDTTAVAAAVDVLLRAGSVLFVGLGASGLIAQDALQKSVLFGVPCAAPTDVHQQYMAASMCAEGDVVVAISNTGRTDAVLEVAAAARAGGATVVAITGGPGPLAELADVPLVVRTFEDTDIYTPTISRLAGLVLMDILATSVAVRRGPEHLERLRSMKEGLSSFRGSADEPTT
ncbi:RpiR family transcriptional regulator [Pseudonocardia sp. MH-G8]|nr:RpiR family transcriptional regulator [Pseudonocardia sp. MH-G8]